jgi:4'-phosphopantetheinyl transferase EntD
MDLVPIDIAWVHHFGDVDGAFDALYPEEAAHMARAVAKRRREFASVRMCARQALADLGVEPAPLLPGRGGAPVWPDAVVGSMTHCAGYRACAVATRDRYAAIGIDAEPHEPVPADVAMQVLGPAERRRLPGVHADRLVFCAKEAVFKAWFPLTGRWLDFPDVRIEPALDGTFAARFLVPGPVVGGRRLGELTGRWRLDSGLIVVALTVPASPVSAAC